jgi:SPP1 family predicted phage head-tail adaptor
MRAGRLDRRVTIQRKSDSYSASGEPVETWSTLATRWAYVAPVSGDERFSTPQLVARQQSEFGVRWSSDISDLTPLDRIVYPPVPDTSPAPPIPSTSIYDIVEVHEIGRREGFKIIAVRRADTG